MCTSLLPVHSLPYSCNSKYYSVVLLVAYSVSSCVDTVIWHVCLSVCLSISQDAQDVYLEHKREETLAKKIIVIQKMVKGWHARRKFLRMKKNVVVIQAAWRGYAQRKRYLVSRNVLDVRIECSSGLDAISAANWQYQDCSGCLNWP